MSEPMKVERLREDAESWPLGTPVVGYGFSEEQNQLKEFPEEIEIAAPWDTEVQLYVKA